MNILLSHFSKTLLERGCIQNRYLMILEVEIRGTSLVPKKMLILIFDIIFPISQYFSKILYAWVCASILSVEISLVKKIYINTHIHKRLIFAPCRYFSNFVCIGLYIDQLSIHPMQKLENQA